MDMDLKLERDRTLGTEESGRCREATVAERLKQE